MPALLPITLDTHQHAVRIAERTGYRFYDSLILASALQARCDTVWSEDMTDGQRIEDALTIVNPFRVSPP